MIRKVFTDGACSWMYGGWACSIDGEVYSGSFPQTTNNAMEMWAVLEALNRVDIGDNVCLFTDSKLVWGWLVRGWKRNKPHIDAIWEAIQNVKEAKDLTVIITVVPGHSYVEGNNIVDQLAFEQSQCLKNEKRAGGVLTSGSD